MNSDNDKNICIVHQNITNRVGKKLYYLVECTRCRFCIFKRIDQIKDNAWKCKSCEQFKLFLIANTLNFNLIKFKNSSSIELECLSCRTRKVTQSSHLRHNGVRCETCITRKYSNILEQSSCKYIKRYTKGKSNNLYIVYYDENKIEKEVQASHLLSNNWLDSKVERNKIQHEKIYVYKFSFVVKNHKDLLDGEYFKIGVSAFPEIRLRRLKIIFKANLQILQEFSNYKEAITYERKLHIQNFDSKVNSEDVLIFSKGKITNKYPDGYTEWFINKLED